jgi:hypothetical protein
MFQDSIIASESNSEHLTSGFFEVSPLGCLSQQEHADCERVVPTEGGFKFDLYGAVNTIFELIQKYRQSIECHTNEIFQ